MRLQQVDVRQRSKRRDQVAQQLGAVDCERLHKRFCVVRGDFIYVHCNGVDFLLRDNEQRDGDTGLWPDDLIHFLQRRLQRIGIVEVLERQLEPGCARLVGVESNRLIHDPETELRVFVRFFTSSSHDVGPLQVDLLARVCRIRDLGSEALVGAEHPRRCRLLDQCAEDVGVLDPIPVEHGRQHVALLEFGRRGGADKRDRIGVFHAFRGQFAFGSQCVGRLAVVRIRAVKPGDTARAR